MRPLLFYGFLACVVAIMTTPTWQTERSVAISRARQDKAYREGYEAGKKAVGVAFAKALGKIDVKTGAKVMAAARAMLKEEADERPEHNPA